MEISQGQKKTLMMISVLIFIGLLFYIQVWMLPFSDYPYQDEYHSILQAMGKHTYTNTLYVHFLSLFTFLSRNFYDIFTLNFIFSNFLLTVTFFFYHKKRSISLSTNLFFTSMLALNALNIALSRKMHFWAPAFYFLILMMGDWLEGMKRKIFLVMAFVALAFFRMEFAFAAVFAFGDLVGMRKSRRHFFIFSGIGLLAGAIAVGLIYRFGPGMKDLVAVSLGSEEGSTFNLWDQFFNIVVLFVSNVGRYSQYVAHTFASTLKIYFFTLMNAFILIVVMIKPIRENLKNLWENIKNDQVYYLAALFLLLVVRFLDSYIIMFYVLFLSFLSFLLNSKRPDWLTPVVFALILPAFFIGKPDFEENLGINFPSIRGYNGLVNRPMHELVASLPKTSYEQPYRILSLERLEEVQGREGLEFYLYQDLVEVCGKGPLDFDVVLIQEYWKHTPNRLIIQSCLIPKLQNMRAYPLARGYDLYLGPRLQGVPLKLNPVTRQ